MCATVKLFFQQAGGSILDTTKTKFALKDGNTKEEKQSQRPLLPKSAILRMLSEIIKSYSNCTLLITQYMYHAGQSELVQEVRTFLSNSFERMKYTNLQQRICSFTIGFSTCNGESKVTLQTLTLSQTSPGFYVSAVQVF